MSKFPLHVDRWFRNTALKLAAMALLIPAMAQADSLPGYRSFPFTLPSDTDRMMIVNSGGDQLSDLMTIAGNTISLYVQDAERGFDFSAPASQLELPGNAVGWDITDNLADGDFSLIALIDGNRVLRWPLQNGRFGEPRELIGGLNGFLGKGVYRLNFSRDVNNDGLDDLIIPGAGELELYIRNADGSYQPPLTVLSDMQLRSVMDPGRELDRSVGQSLRIPLMELRDVNNDGLPDLISDTEERFDVFLANRSGTGAYFPTEPSYSIDRVAIRERLGDFDIDQLDFSNLTGVLALTHEEILRDMNGDGIDDMILREGGRVALHLGSATGINLEQPDQILRSGGNVLSVFMHDENGNGRPDLWLWRIEQISLGDLFLWLAVSGTINLEAFVYHNEGNSFARRPARRITVALRFPSAVRMISSVRDVRDRARNMDAVIPSARAQIQSNQSSAADTERALQDLLVLVNEQVEVFYRSIQPEPELADDRFLASLGYSRGRDNYEIDIRRIIDEFDIEVNRDVTLARRSAPDLTLSLPGEARRGDIVATDLNNNGRDDIFVFMERSKEQISGVLWLSE
jgi:hypothetical protein